MTALLFGGLIAANFAAWTWAWAAFHDRPTLLGTALLAWVFGLRHAVDADHIAAIDNVVRRSRMDACPSVQYRPELPTTIGPMHCFPP